NANAEMDVILFLELNLTSLHISIFHDYQLEFLRYQPLTLSVKDWETHETKPLTWQFIGEEQRLYSEIEDQLNEIERLMNFYRFSLHQGNKKVSKIVLLGDNPYLENAKDLIEHRFQVKTIQMNM